MVYKPSVPQASDRFAQSQIDFKQNFAQVGLIYGQNHTNLDAGQFLGDHTVVSYLAQGAAPATGATEKALYSQSDTGIINIYSRSQASGTSFQVSKSAKVYQNLVLEAWVMFGADGKVKEQKYPDGPTGDEWRQLKSSNVASVVAVAAANVYTYTITFTPVLSSANPFWMISQRYPKVFGDTGANMVVVQPAANTVFSSSVSASTLVLEARLSSTVAPPLNVPPLCDFIMVQMFTLG